MFGRRRKKQGQDPEQAPEGPSVQQPADGPQEAQEEPEAETGGPDESGRADPEGADSASQGGPWDSAQEVPRHPRIDFGSLRIPVAKDLGVSWETDRDRKRITAIRVLYGKTMLRVQAFAAPKSGGLWGEVREELASGVSGDSGRYREVEGTFGPELHVVVPLKGRTDSEGRQMGQRARLIGVDGPRWMLRVTVQGAGAADREAARRVDAIVRGIVVVRGAEPMPPREPLPLRLSSKTQELLERARARAAEQGGEQEPDGGAEAVDGDVEGVQNDAPDTAQAPREGQ